MKVAKKELEVRPYPKNAKKHPDSQLKVIANSIKEFGWKQPIVVDKNGTIIVGHGRYLAYKKYPQGLGKPWIMVADDLTPEQVRAYRLADNKSNESGWDMGLAIEELKELDTLGFDIEITGFSKDLLIEPDEKDDIIPTDAPTRAKMGDLWQLGDHRVLCGDSTQKEAVERLMGGKKADMVFTDPPYGMDLKVDQWNTPAKKGQWVSNKKDYTQVIGDTGEFNPDLINTIFDNFGDVGEVFIWGADYFAECLPKRKNGSWIVWDKRSGGLENVKWTTSEFELCWSKIKHHRKIARIRWMGVHGMEKEDTSKRVHPTQKPVELVKWFFGNWGDENDIVADLFLGSGSTLIAAEKTGRICYGMEIDCRYIDVILKRWEDYTGKEAVKV